MQQRTPSRRSTRMTPQEAKKIAKKMNDKSRQVLSQVGSAGEEVLARHLQVNKILYQREYRFNPNKKFRADFFIPAFNLLVEVEGGTRNKSRHTTHDGYSTDLMKYNSAQILGYARLAFTTQQVNNGLAIQTIKEFMKARTQDVLPHHPEPNPVIKKILDGAVA